MYNCEKGSVDNRVIVRVWTSDKHPTHQGHDVGHVSIEIPKIVDENGKTFYVSLWPTRALPQSLLSQGDEVGDSMGLFKPEPGKNLTTYAKDRYHAENRSPEVLYCLYHLDINMIFTEFNRITSSLDGWNILGPNLLHSNTHSCASLAYTLLMSGGIEELRINNKRMHEKSIDGSKDSIPNNPDRISEILGEVKLYEATALNCTHEYEPLYPGDIGETFSLPRSKCTLL